MKARRSWWLMYGACVVVGIGALTWVTVMALRLERAERDARSEAALQESTRLALWRMDSWLAPQLAQETARSFYEYQAFAPQPLAYTKGLAQLDSDAVLTPSPLMNFDSDVFSLHFQVAPDGTVSSPQAPSGGWRELAEDIYLPSPALCGNVATLAEVKSVIAPDQLMACVANVTTEPPAQADVPDVRWRDQVQAPPRQIAAAQQLRTDLEQTQRQRSYQLNTQKAQGPQGASYSLPLPPPKASDGIEALVPPGIIGTLVPIWVTIGDARQLLFVRQVQRPDGDYYQGFLCDWPALEAALLGEIRDLFTAAALVPIEPGNASEGARGTQLATIPVSLEVPPFVPLAMALLSPARSGLALTWLALIAAIVAIAITLRASIDYGMKRSRFASAVTHELRTPLTTFRMYTEMLAEGMVKSDEQRAAYIDTLRDESGRLSTLVENVLSYARLEEGRSSTHVRPVPVGDLLERLLPRLERRAEEVPVSLRAKSTADDVVLTTDVEAVGQILYNLIDNACKYAVEDAALPIELSCRADETTVRITVRDHGPGVPPRQQRSLFVAFERGAHDASEQPGIGLGLALSAGLARDLSGTLAYRAADGGGACFELTLPRNEQA